jgi:hypothetical protein
MCNRYKRIYPSSQRWLRKGPHLCSDQNRPSLEYNQEPNRRYHLHGFDLSLNRSRKNKLDYEWIAIVLRLRTLVSRQNLVSGQS